MKNLTSHWRALLIPVAALLFSSGLRASFTNCEMPCPVKNLERTYTPQKAPEGAGSWLAEREAFMASRYRGKSAGLVITAADFAEHLSLSNDRFVDNLIDSNKIFMDVGEEGVEDGYWVMPDLSPASGAIEAFYTSLDPEATDTDNNFPDATHAYLVDTDITLGEDFRFNYLRLIPSDDILGDGELINLGYQDGQELYEYNGTQTPVPLSTELLSYETVFSGDCAFFARGCRLNGQSGDNFDMNQTFLPVASGLLEVWDQEDPTEAVKVRQTDSITVFDVNGTIAEIFVFNYIVWYSKDGHYLRARLNQSAPWTGATRFDIMEYQVLEPFVLPVDWLSVSAKALKNKQVQVNWSTANESQNAGFTVERSSDRNDFSPVAEVAVATSAPDVQNDYRFIDDNPTEGFNYYRIRQTDADGSSSYSSIVSALITTTDSDDEIVVLYPNPGRNEVYFSRPAKYELLASDGRLLASGYAEDRVDVSKLPAGSYLVRIDGGEAYRWVKR